MCVCVAEAQSNLDRNRHEMLHKSQRKSTSLNPASVWGRVDREMKGKGTTDYFRAIAQIPLIRTMLAEAERGGRGST